MRPFLFLLRHAILNKISEVNMYELYDAKTKQLVRVTISELEQGLADGTLLSELPSAEEKPRKQRAKAADDENQS